MVPTEPQNIIEPCPHCGQLIDVTEEEPFSEVTCPTCGGAMRARRKFNHFAITDLLGEGGMGSVFKAIDVNLNRPVALKILRRHADTKIEDFEKLAVEARLTASINHPHVVKVFSFGEDHGQFYLAMELVEMGSLDDLMNLQHRVAEAQVLEVGIQVAQGLEAAAEVGLIHRDVKPGNILFADAHTAKIVDFGLAILMEEEAQMRGEIWGTPYYIAPEKLDNRPEDFRSDMYSLGGTLFHAITGRPPFEAQTASLVALKHIKSQAVSLQAFAPDVSSETAYVINRMLDKDPDKRYPSYEELIGHMRYARQKLLERAQGPRSAKARVQLESETSRTFTALIWMVTLLIFVGGGIAIYAFRDRIFPKKEEAPAYANLAGYSAAELYRVLADGQGDMVGGRFADARERFAVVVREAPANSTLRSWALLNQALAVTLDGGPGAAAPLWGQLGSAREADEAEDPKLAEFLLQLGRRMRAADAVDARGATDEPDEGYESIAWFAYGLKEWYAGRFEAAEAWFARFADATPPAQYDWIVRYRSLAESFMEDYELYTQLKKRVEAVKSAADLPGAIAAIEEARGSIKTGKPMSERFALLIGEARARSTGKAP